MKAPELQTSESAAEMLGILIGETGRVWRARLDQRLQALGLNHARWLVVLHVWRAGDDLIQKDLATRIGIEGPTLVGLLDRMAADGWIERRECQHDRRSKTVHLTRKSRTAVPRIRAIAAQLRQELLAGIAVADVECCRDVLQRIKHAAELNRAEEQDE